MKTAEELDKDWSNIFMATCKDESFAEVHPTLNVMFLNFIRAIQSDARDSALEEAIGKIYGLGDEVQDEIIAEIRALKGN